MTPAHASDARSLDRRDRYLPPPRATGFAALLKSFAIALTAVAPFAMLAGRARLAPVRMALALWLLTTAAAIAFRFVSSLRGRRAAAFETRARELEAEVMEKLALHAALGTEVVELGELARREPHIVARCLARFLPAIRGYQRDRLSALAVTLGLAPRAALEQGSAAVRRKALMGLASLSAGVPDPSLFRSLNDADEAVRIEAARALIRSAEHAALESALSFATTQRPIVRALLAEELRPHLLELDLSAVTELLESRDPRRVAAMLEIIGAWGRALPVAGVERLLQAPQPLVRARALKVLRLVGATPAAATAVVAALADSTPEVRAAAADAAGQLRLEPAAEYLARGLNDAAPVVAWTCADALARIGPAGARLLEQEIAAGSPVAALAIETLQRTTLGLAESWA